MSTGTYDVYVIEEKKSLTGEKVGGDDYAYKSYGRKSDALAMAKKLSNRKTFKKIKIHEVWVTRFIEVPYSKDDWFFRNGKLSIHLADS
jgi:hypothetical protein